MHCSRAFLHGGLIGIGLLLASGIYAISVLREEGIVVTAAGNSITTTAAVRVEQVESTPPRTCSFATRRRLVDEVCSRSQPITHGLEYDVPTLGIIIVSEEDRVMYCKLNKAANKATTKFFARVNEEKGYRNFPRYSFQEMKDAKNAPQGYKLVKGVPLKEAIARYSDYKKILITRHPLQRFVSAYYEVVVNGKLLIGRSIQNLTHFIEQSIIEQNAEDKHSRDYRQLCLPCAINYDVIAKTETLEHDMPYIVEAAGIQTKLKIPHIHANPNFEAPQEREAVSYKYDTILRKLKQDRPELFEHVMAKYKTDMEMFGYLWREDRSKCVNELGNCC